MKKQPEEVVTIQPMNIVTTQFRIVGDSPLIVHAWSEKAKRQMLETVTGKSIKSKGKARDARNPVYDFVNSMYWLDKKPTGSEITEEDFETAVASGARWGFPVLAVKAAAINAAYRNGIVKNKVSLQGAMFLEGEGPEMLGEIKGCTPEMREDMVRLMGATADLRFRGQFTNWYMDITMKYNQNGIFTLEHLLNFINVGGFSSGIGEWRAERGGTFGAFHIEPIR